jgi:secondary thiamine-phosphate synthase enzyme
MHHQVTISTRGKGIYEFTRQVQVWVAETGVRQGVLHLFVRHTSASLLIQENADPDVQTDLSNWFERLVPERDELYVHTVEGPDDMPAHVRSALTQVNLTVPVLDGRLALGTWQGIYLFEHRRAPHTRTVVLSILGE